MRDALSTALGFALSWTFIWGLTGCHCESTKPESKAAEMTEGKRDLPPLLEQPLPLPKCFQVTVPRGARDKRHVEIRLGRLLQGTPNAGATATRSADGERMERFVVHHECDEMMSQEELSRSLRAVLSQLKNSYGAHVAPPPLALLAAPDHSASALAWMKEEPTFFADALLSLSAPDERETLALRAFAARGGRRLALLIPQGPQAQRLGATLRHPGFSARFFEPGSGAAAAIAWLQAEPMPGK